MSVNVAEVRDRFIHSYVTSEAYPKVKDLYAFLLGNFPNMHPNPVAAYVEGENVAVQENIPLRADLAVNKSKLLDIMTTDLGKGEDNFLKKWNADKLKFRKTTPAKFAKVVMPNLSESEARDYGQVIKSLTLPITLEEATTREQYFAMHKVRVQTCMASWEPWARTNGHATAIRNRMLDMGHWQSDLYASMPFFKGVYIKQGDTPLARSFIITRHDTGKKIFRYVRGISPVFINKMKAMLEEQGYVNDISYVVNLANFPPFEFEGIKNGEEDYLCPLPYADDIVSGYYVTYIGNGKFRVGGKEGHYINSPYFSKGYVNQHYKYPQE